MLSLLRTTLRVAAVGALASVAFPQLAAANGPRSSVLAGDPQVVDALVAELSALGVFCRRVENTVGSHSPFIEPVLPELGAALAGIRPRATSR